MSRNNTSSNTVGAARLIIFLSIVIPGTTLADNVLDKVSQWKEEKMLARLAEVQDDESNELAEFKTDGCSGGLSKAWAWMAETFPAFELNYDNEPPWEHCCVAHDKIYWQGETNNGFELRKQADKALQQCVIASGKDKARELANASDIKRFAIEKGFEKVALQMYIAVRLGGGPCTPFPWRWGYGWPDCSLIGEVSGEDESDL